mmetsp:Transcript_38882/g.60572  ORF Transcript_38882/g.60572 Transcript_38882/m.60572 type:complete len:775 (+) Transcript_38882:2-2326(+)
MGISVSAQCDSRTGVSCSERLGIGVDGLASDVPSGLVPMVSGYAAVSSTSAPSSVKPLACGGLHCECSQTEESLGRPIYAEAATAHGQDSKDGDCAKHHSAGAHVGVDGRFDATGDRINYDFWNPGAIPLRNEGDNRRTCPKLENISNLPRADAFVNEVGDAIPMTPVTVWHTSSVALENVPMQGREQIAWKHVPKAYTPRREPPNGDAVDSVMDHITNNFTDVRDAIGSGPDSSFVPLVVVRGEDGAVRSSWDKRKHRIGLPSSQRRTGSTSFKPIRPRIFTIILERSSHEDRLGIDVSHQDGRTLLILEVKAGLVAGWNASHPSMDVTSGDRIVQVNSVQSRSDLMLKECENLGVLEMTIKRARVLYHCTEPAAKFFSHRSPCTPRHEINARTTNDGTTSMPPCSDADVTVDAALKASGASEYFRSDASLWALLQDGDAVLVRGSWLAELARSQGVLPRRQDLPATALLLPEAVFRPNAGGGGDPDGEQNLHRQMEIVVVSYCWLTTEHPDPRGEHLQLLGSAIDKYLQSEKHDLGIFIDWCCLYQAPRTSEEQLAFDRSLGKINAWYAHQHTRKWMLTKTPDSSTTKRYEDRGWTSFECILGQMVAQPSSVLDLGKFDPAHCKDWRSLSACCALVARPPPMSPEEFVCHLEAKAFSTSSDRAFLVAKYKATFEDIFASAERLDFSFHDWGDEQVRLLANALPHFVCLKCLYLNWNHIGDAGVEEIVARLPLCASLLELSLAGNPISSACGRRLREVWRSVGKSDRQKLILW